MRPYAIAVGFVLGLGALLLWGANVQPILTGAGFLKFPENSTPAYLSASGGQLTVASGGSNQNLVLAPSGTGYVVAGKVATGAWPVASTYAFFQNSSLSATNTNFALAQGPGGPTFLNSPSTVHVQIGNTDLGIFTSAGLSILTGTTPGYPLDVLGDVNSSTKFRVNGTPGISASVAGGSSLTVQGGIITASSAAGTPSTSSGSITGTNGSWHDAVGAGTVNSFVVTWGGTFNPNACVVSGNSSAVIFISALSSSSATVASLSNMGSSTIYGICQ